MVVNKGNLKNTKVAEHWSDAFPEMWNEILEKQIENWLKGVENGKGKENDKKP